MIRAVTAREQSDRSNSEKNSELIESIFQQIDTASKNGLYEIKIKEKLDEYTTDYLKQMGYMVISDYHVNSIKTAITWW